MTKMVTVDHKDTFVRAFLVLMQLASAVIKYADSRLFHEYRLSMIKFAALQVLVFNGGKMTHSELARCPRECSPSRMQKRAPQPTRQHSLPPIEPEVGCLV